MRKVSDKCCRKNQNTYIMFNNFPAPRKSCRLWENVEKYDRTGQVTDDSIIRRTRFACWTTKTTGTQSKYAILIVFYGNFSYANALQCYFYTCIASLVNLWHKTEARGSAAPPENFKSHRANTSHWTVCAVESRTGLITA
jgi:hypothetical protein